MIDKELIRKYKQKIEREIQGANLEKEEAGYSQAYLVFKKEQAGKLHSFYERACRLSEKILKIKINPKDAEKVKPFIDLAHLSITPESVYSFTYLTSLLSLVLFLIIGLISFNLLFILIGLAVVLGILFYFPTIPRRIFLSWRSRASDQLVLAVLYLVIYVKHTANLERAVKFVAEHMPPPISLDFMKVLWDVETKTYSSVKESLDAYLETWRNWDEEFVESVQLIESAFYEPDPERKNEILDKAVSVLLEGTQDNMISFAHNLQSPIQSLHMLGIVLPVMGLVMLPMIGAFMGASIKWYYLVLLYNVFLPLGVYFIGKSILSTRPAGTDETDIYFYLQKKYSESKATLFGKEIKIPSHLIGFLVFLLISSPAFIYFSSLLNLSGDALRDAIYSNWSVYASILIVAGIGFGFAAHYWWSVHKIIKLKKTVEKMEREFSSGIFQLGNRLLEHVPAELAFSRVAQTMSKSEIAKFFITVDYNIRRQGMSLREAIFNSKYGALTYFPSAIIKSMMAVLVEGVKKGPEVAGRSLITISKYLNSVHRVSERLKDLLADTVSSMQMQVKLFIPMISGIVVGLAVLTTTIMLTLGKQISGIETATGAPTAAAPGAGLLEIFQIQYMVPGYIFQLLVGIYLIQIIFLLTMLLSGIINGHDKVEEKYALAKNLFIGTAFYIIITIVVVIIFTALAAPITQVV